MMAPLPQLQTMKLLAILLSTIIAISGGETTFDEKEPRELEWSVADWQQCTATCGGGERSRSVTCMRKITPTEDEIMADRYCAEEKPVAQESCNTETCPPEWVAEGWSQCSPTCGAGLKRRRVSCKLSDKEQTLSNSECDPSNKPVTTTLCSKERCPEPKWNVSHWSSCSVKCGRGRQIRRVQCVDYRKQLSHLCPRSTKPSMYKSCESPCKPTESKPFSNITTVTSFTTFGGCKDDPKVLYCPLVQKYNFCSRAYFRKACCSCRKL